MDVTCPLPALVARLDAMRKHLAKLQGQRVVAAREVFELMGVGRRAAAIGGSAQHTPKKFWRRRSVSKLSANVVKSIQVCGFRLQPLRLAVPRRLLALACWLIEHHIAPLQPDVIKPEAR